MPLLTTLKTFIINHKDTATLSIPRIVCFEYGRSSLSAFKLGIFRVLSVGQNRRRNGKIPCFMPPPVMGRSLPCWHVTHVAVWSQCLAQTINSVEREEQAVESNNNDPDFPSVDSAPCRPPHSAVKSRAYHVLHPHLHISRHSALH